MSRFRARLDRNRNVTIWAPSKDSALKYLTNDFGPDVKILSIYEAV